MAEGWIISPGFPFSYENNMDCVWDVRAPEGHVVVLTVVNLDLEDPNNCPYDWLGVAYTNTMQQEIKMCQPQNIGRIITSRSNFMRIFFHSDVIVTRRGFNVTLSAQGINFILHDILLTIHNFLQLVTLLRNCV